MVYQPRIINALRRTTLVLVFLGLCGINTFAVAGNSKANTAVDSAGVAPSEPAAQPQSSPAPTVAPAWARPRPAFTCGLSAQCQRQQCQRQPALWAR